jgi:hypothetical protein
MKKKKIKIRCDNSNCKVAITMNKAITNAYPNELLKYFCSIKCMLDYRKENG